MRTLASRVVFVSIALTPAVAVADAVYVGQIIKAQTTDVGGGALSRFGQGGPFRVDLPGTANDFLTFCLERNEYFSPGEDIKIVGLTDEAKAGGLAGQDTSTGDRISPKTAFVYRRFRSLDPAYSGPVTQELIWYLENEVTSLGAPAQALFDNLEASMLLWGWDPLTIGQVRVMNLERGAPTYGVRAQDMLTLVPEPTALALLATGAAGLAAGWRRSARRRQRGPRLPPESRQ